MNIRTNKAEQWKHQTQNQNPNNFTLSIPMDMCLFILFCVSFIYHLKDIKNRSLTFWVGMHALKAVTGHFLGGSN